MKCAGGPTYLLMGEISTIHNPPDCGDTLEVRDRQLLRSIPHQKTLHSRRRKTPLN